MAPTYIVIVLGYGVVLLCACIHCARIYINDRKAKAAKESS